MPIVNTLAFLFTVVGEWWVENKVISRGMSQEKQTLRSVSCPLPISTILVYDLLSSLKRLAPLRNICGNDTLHLWHRIMRAEQEWLAGSLATSKGMPLPVLLSIEISVCLHVTGYLATVYWFTLCLL